MLKELEKFLEWLRPAFARRATYYWFVVVFIGFLLRTDNLGVSSIVRALSLVHESYTSLLHFFHSSAWNVDRLMTLFWQWLGRRPETSMVGDRIILVGDHTKTPKDGRKMPAVTTLHQDSETSSKPSFFRGHHWGCIGLLRFAAEKIFCTPVWASIHEGLEGITNKEVAAMPKTIRVVKMAQQVAQAMEKKAYLLLDAYFAVGTVFETANQDQQGERNRVHILTKAKKNVVAYLSPATKKKKKKRGPKKKYGQKLKLIKLFDSKNKKIKFKKGKAKMYDHVESVRYLTLDLIWKPIKGKIRFILVQSSYGQMILMTSDLLLDPIIAIELYAVRMKIETLFNVLKNNLGAMAYHFWSRYLKPTSRRPRKKNTQKQVSSNPTKTRNTLAAIEKFVNVQLLVMAFLHSMAIDFPKQVKERANCFLRTASAGIPSEFVTRMAIVNIIKNNLYGFGKSWITALIQKRQDLPRKNAA